MSLTLINRGDHAPDYADGEHPAGMNNRGDACITWSLPPKAEIVRLGQSWDVRIASGSAFTHVAALPTTRAELVLFNGDPTKCYVVDSVYHLGISSMGAAGSVTLLGQIVSGIAAPTDDPLQLITGRSGRSYGGNAKRAVAQTTMLANRWSILQTSNNGGSATAQIGLATLAEVYGGFILKPGDTFGANAIVGTAEGTGILGIVWHEVELPLG